jgi:hypothetical protein
MYELIYSSKERQHFSPADIKALLIHARAQNYAMGITGMLVHDGGMFLQVLEGDETAVRAVLSRIENDVRHGDINILRQSHVAGSRRFGYWSMGFSDVSGAAQILREFVNPKKRIASDATGKRAATFLEAVSREPLRKAG